MKKLLRDWLGMTEEKTRLEIEVRLLTKRLDQLAHTASRIGTGLRKISNELEEKPTHEEVEEAIRDLAYCDIEYIQSDLDVDYSEIKDKVFDLVMQEIKDKDTLEELVEYKLETLTDEGRNNTGTYPDVTEIVEDVLEELINKLRA